jgi:hypothetical protein
MVTPWWRSGCRMMGHELILRDKMYAKPIALWQP